MTNAEARFNKSLRPRKPEGSLGRTAQDVHLDSHTAPELCWIYSLIQRTFIESAENLTLEKSQRWHKTLHVSHPSMLCLTLAFESECSCSALPALLTSLRVATVFLTTLWQWHCLRCHCPPEDWQQHWPGLTLKWPCWGQCCLLHHWCRPGL